MKMIKLFLVSVFFIFASTAQAQVIHRAHAGGPDICESQDNPIGCNANFSLVALEMANGRIKGQFTDQFGGGDGFHAVIDCLVVDGQDAWVSGWVTSGSLSDLDLEGFPVWAQVVDMGTSQNDTPDRISFSFIGSFIPCTEKPQGGTFAVPQGQVRVE